MMSRVPITRAYTNPILPGLNPDPTICRVGEDYYLATSTMFLFPGVPIYHSRDLTSWELIGHALTRAEHFFLEQNNASPMIFAPTLRHHEGLFYLVTTDVHGGGNFFVTATDPAGPWSDPIKVDRPIFDPSLFFDDDGKTYYTRRGEFKDKDIVQAQIDSRTGKLLTPLRSLGVGMVSDDVEAPHVYKRGAWYYLTCAEGGSRGLHMQTIGRSKNIWGPFEPCPHNPIIAQHHAWGHPVRGIGHADFVDTPDGQSFAVCLATRHADYGALSAIGRETFLLPVIWNDDWPTIDAKAMRTLDPISAPLPPSQTVVSPAIRDDFDGDALALPWSLLAYPTTQLIDLRSKPGTLRLRGQADAPAQTKQAALVARRQTAHAFRFETLMRFVPASANEESGISVFQTREYHYDLFTTLRSGHPAIVLRKTVGDLVVESGTLPIEADRLIRLRVEGDAKRYRFSFASGDGDWQPLGDAQVRLISTEVADVWSGVLLGLYSTGNGTTCATPAEFDWCEYAAR